MVQGRHAAVRARLGAEAEVHASTLARCAAARSTSSSANFTSLDRAMNALRMYTSLEALEAIEIALDRIEAGTYGTCVACDQPIPLEDLAAIPQARFCVACSASAASAVEGSPEPRLGSGRGEHTGALSPVRSPRRPDRSPEDVAGKPVSR
jgi:RNA polymerase-binding transcription factor DksA